MRVILYAYRTNADKKGVKNSVSEKEKQIVEKLKEVIPKMSDFDKGYILGKTEKMAEESAERKEDGRIHS